MMNNRYGILTAIILSAIILVGCSPKITEPITRESEATISQVKNTETQEYLKSQDEVYQKIFAELESGGYAKAEEIIQSEIVGNIVTEGKSEEVCQEYIDALLHDYENGVIETDAVELLLETVRRTSFADYYSFSDYFYDEFYPIRSSKESYKSAMAILEVGNGNVDVEDYGDAINHLIYVSAKDMKRTDALQALTNAIDQIYHNASNLRELYPAARGCIKVFNVYEELRGNGGYLSTENEVNADDLEKYKDQCVNVAFNIAKTFEEGGADRFAIQLFSVVRNNYLEAQDRYATILREYNNYNMGYDSDRVYQILPTGAVTRVSEYGFTLDNEELNAVQVVESYEWKDQDKAFLAILSDDGRVYLKRTSALGNDSSFSHFFDEVFELNNIVKIYAPKCFYSGQEWIVALTDRGEIVTCGFTAPFLTEYLPSGVVDFIADAGIDNSGAAHGDFVFLTSYGTTWVNGTNINSAAYSRQDIFQLNSDFKSVLTFDKQIIDEYGNVIYTDDIKQIAGNYALSNDGYIADYVHSMNLVFPNNPHFNRILDTGYQIIGYAQEFGSVPFSVTD